VDARRGNAMWTLAVDAVTVEVTAALAEAGVASLLLKGPSIAEWLYEDPAARSYTDSDLLVDPDGVAVARTKLAELGFRAEFGPLPHPGMESPPSQPWRRADFAVDLHTTLEGAGVGAREVWAVLRPGATEQTVGGRRLLVLGEPARLAHVALHAGHHGAAAERPLEDLRRALARIDLDGWRSAAGVAERIAASPLFAAGLELLPEGRRLLAPLGLEGVARERLPRVPVAAGFARLRASRGLRAKAGLLVHELVPSADFMRWWTPLARRGPRGLLAAYVWRWLWLLWHAARVAIWRRSAHS
jgi:hypothetical protein